MVVNGGPTRRWALRRGDGETIQGSAPLVGEANSVRPFFGGLWGLAGVVDQCPLMVGGFPFFFYFVLSIFFDMGETTATS
jgi:hypothetical protein